MTDADLNLTSPLLLIVKAHIYLPIDHCQIIVIFHMDVVQTRALACACEA